MTLIEVDVGEQEYYRKFRKEVGLFMFEQRQRRNCSLKSAAAKIHIRPEELDLVELGKVQLRIPIIIKLLGLYHIGLQVKFSDKKNNLPIIELS